MERVILNRLKWIRFFLFIVICLIFVLLDIYVSKKKSFIFDFYVRKIYVIVFVLMVIEEMFFLYIYNILYVYDIVLEKIEKEVFIIYVVMIFVLLSDLNIIMYILS